MGSEEVCTYASTPPALTANPKSAVLKEEGVSVGLQILGP